MLLLDNVEKIKAWAEFFASIRHWMSEKGYLEITTDCLGESSAIDAVLDPLKVTYAAGGGGNGELQTSPEFEMKWVLSLINLPIYQICKSFRDDPLTPIHKREFSMLEFYRPGATIAVTIEEMKSLISRVNQGDPDFEEMTVTEAVKKFSSVDLGVSLEEFRRQAEENAGIHLSSDDRWDDIYFKLMIEKVEPAIGGKNPTILKDFPATLASLAKVEGHPPVAKRFEIYWRGMELCNGFDELTDVSELERRVKKEQQIRAAQGKTPHPFPRRLHEAMKRGVPPSSGVAVGLDRLFNCLDKSRAWLSCEPAHLV